jgi:hypothetical protein
MPHPDRRGNAMQTLDSYVAAAQLSDLHTAAASSRAARRARTSPAAPFGARLVLRRAQAEDERALARLARLDSAPRPTGDVLVAEVDEQIVAAIPVDGGRAIADPFRPTADVVEVLRARAERLAPAARTRRPRLRLPRVRVA